MCECECAVCRVHKNLHRGTNKPDDATQPRYIQTVWGVGYVFVPDGVA